MYQLNCVINTYKNCSVLIFHFDWITDELGKKILRCGLRPEKVSAVTFYNNVMVLQAVNFKDIKTKMLHKFITEAGLLNFKIMKDNRII